MDFAGQNIAQGRQHVLTRSGLGQKTGRAFVHGLTHHLPVAGARQHDDRQFRMFFAKHIERIDPVHVRQLVIEQHQINIVVAVGELKSSGAVPGLQHLNLLIESLENLVQTFPHQRMIIDNKNLHDFYLVILTIVCRRRATEMAISSGITWEDPVARRATRCGAAN